VNLSGDAQPGVGYNCAQQQSPEQGQDAPPSSSQGLAETAQPSVPVTYYTSRGLVDTFV